MSGVDPMGGWDFWGKMLAVFGAAEEFNHLAYHITSEQITVVKYNLGILILSICDLSVCD